MKYTDQKSKTIYENIEVEVPDGDSYFHTWNEDDEPEYYYRLHIKKDPQFDILYNIAVTKICVYEDDLFVGWKEICEPELPYSLRGYFCGEKDKKEITEEEFNIVKQQVLNKLK